MTMMIAPDALRRTALAALEQWPWIADSEDIYHLPRWILLAVGSRETNLRHVVGDGGHGHGPWQLDDRTPGRAAKIARIDSGDTRYAADIAAQMLASLHAHNHGDWLKALNQYNSGQTRTDRTAHGNYGPDVLARLEWLQANLASLAPAAPVSMELDVQLAPTAFTGFLPASCAGVLDRSPLAGWKVTADGGVHQATDDTPWWGSYPGLPEHVRNAPRVFFAIVPRRDRQVGFELCSHDGAYYTFGPGLNGFAS